MDVLTEQERLLVLEQKQMLEQVDGQSRANFEIQEQQQDVDRYGQMLRRLREEKARLETELLFAPRVIRVIQMAGISK
jgi:hypothetical protein